MAAVWVQETGLPGYDGKDRLYVATRCNVAPVASAAHPATRYGSIRLERTSNGLLLPPRVFVWNRSHFSMLNTELRKSAFW